MRPRCRSNGGTSKTHLRTPRLRIGHAHQQGAQIAYPVADAKRDQAIADDLGISECTPREHMRRSFHKLEVGKRAALVAQRVEGRVDDRANGNGCCRVPAVAKRESKRTLGPAGGRTEGKLSAIGLREAPFSG
jgi:DNA-binding CsgD family transcriptional regulator